VVGSISLGPEREQTGVYLDERNLCDIGGLRRLPRHTCKALEVTSLLKRQPIAAIERMIEAHSMNRWPKTLVFAILAFALALLLSHKLYVGVAGAGVVGAGTYLTWWRQSASTDYAVSGGMVCLIGIALTAQGHWLPAVFVFVAAIGCTIRANSRWKREHA
jgi:hypothetical protein